MSDYQWCFENSEEAAELINNQQQCIAELEALHWKREQRLVEMDAGTTRLRDQIAELESHVERFREFLKDCYGHDVDEDYLPIPKDEIADMLDETPAQSLNEIKATAIEEALQAGETILVDDGFEDQLICIDIAKVKDYAKQLRSEK